MAVVKANGIGKVYPEGTTYLEIARDFQDQYENDILLVRVNGKLRELDKTLTEDSEISFITAEGNAGYKTYERCSESMGCMIRSSCSSIGGHRG